MGRIVLRKQEQPQEQSQEPPTVEKILEDVRENFNEFLNRLKEYVAKGKGGEKAFVEFLKTRWKMDEETAKSYVIPLIEGIAKDKDLSNKLSEATKRAVAEWTKEEKSIQGVMRKLVRKELMKALERLKKEISF
ncbi:MAG: hypothetical protein QW815_00470 [Nitrososphaerota archaeon]